MIVLEHTLIMLLLLISLLRARPRMPRFARWAAMGVVLLAFFAPAVPLVLPWTLFSALVIPLLLWQTAQRLGNSRWVSDWRDLLVWTILVVGIAGVIYMTGNLPLANAVLFGLLVASIAWHAASENTNDSLLGQIGLLTLVFLITEVDAVVESPGQYVLGLLNGAVVGAVIGYFAVLIGRRLPSGMQRDLFSLGQVYLAYLAALLLGVSPITAAVMSIIIYVGYGTRCGLWPEGVIRPKAFNYPVVYGLAVVALAFFGWQVHVPLTPVLALEIGLGLVITALAVWIGHLIKTPAFQGENNLRQILAYVGLLLIPALLLWPRDVLLTPVPLAIALAAATLTALGAHFLLAPLLNFYGWLEKLRFDLDFGMEVQKGDESVLKVRDLMRRDPVTAAPEVSVQEIARLLLDRSAGCVLVVDEIGKLAGIVTERDLFVKEGKLPRTDRTYPALFKHPIMPEKLPEAYARVKDNFMVNEIMTQPVVTIKESDTVGYAVQTMVKFGIRFLPVMQDDPGGEVEVVAGLLARSDIIRLLLARPHEAHAFSDHNAREDHR